MSVVHCIAEAVFWFAIYFTFLARGFLVLNTDGEFRRNDGDERIRFDMYILNIHIYLV